jgi:type IV fimbrial biogenesis protein FimT
VLSHRLGRGFSIIELMIGIAVLAALIAAGIPSMTQFMQNSQLRTSAESILSGIQVARGEALKRNVQTRFTLVDDVVAGCQKLNDGGSWIVSLDFVDGDCNVAPSESTTPRILQARSSKEGGTNAVVAASGGGGANHTLVFNGLGRLVITNLDQFTQIDITNPTGGQCQHAATDGTMRCLRIVVTPGGDARMCDPKVSDSTDPRAC